MPADKDGFDHEWDIKGNDGMNVTERKVYNELKKRGLKPEPQYKISQMKVDFAFPDVKLAIEINGPHHETPEQRETDKKRWFVLQREGWKRSTYDAETSYNKPYVIARRIKKQYEKLLPITPTKPKPTYIPIFKPITQVKPKEKNYHAIVGFTLLGVIILILLIIAVTILIYYPELYFGQPISQ